MGKVIDLGLLDSIIEAFKIPRDVRARKEIDNVAVPVSLFTLWFSPAMTTPTHTDTVLVIIDGQLGPHEIHNARHTARYKDGVGWVLDATDGDLIDFTVKWWAEFPKLPEELENHERLPTN